MTLYTYLSAFAYATTVLACIMLSCPRDCDCRRCADR